MVFRIFSTIKDSVFSQAPSKPFLSAKAIVFILRELISTKRVLLPIHYKQRSIGTALLPHTSNYFRLPKYPLLRNSTEFCIVLLQTTTNGTATVPRLPVPTINCTNPLFPDIIRLKSFGETAATVSQRVLTLLFRA